MIFIYDLCLVIIFFINCINQVNNCFIYPAISETLKKRLKLVPITSVATFLLILDLMEIGMLA